MEVVKQKTGDYCPIGLRGVPDGLDSVLGRQGRSGGRNHREKARTPPRGIPPGSTGGAAGCRTIGRNGCSCWSPVPAPSYRSVMAGAVSPPSSTPGSGGRERGRAWMPGRGPGTSRSESPPNAVGRSEPGMASVVRPWAGVGRIRRGGLIGGAVAAGQSATAFDRGA